MVRNHALFVTHPMEPSHPVAHSLKFLDGSFEANKRTIQSSVKDSLAHVALSAFAAVGPALAEEMHGEELQPLSVGEEV